MYALEGDPLPIEESTYEDVDARTIQLLQAELTKRAKASEASDEASADPVTLDPELVR